jgi:myo-inositol 2-dehydrogenase/D-chiro-inositol 1-dehydrogenase
MASDSTFQLGLVGAGRMGRTHLRALEGSRDVKVVAACEPVDALRDEVTSTYQIAGFSTLEELLGHGGLDGVLIVTPSDTHVQVIETVARAGLPMLCEKPCGVSPEDTRRAVALVDKYGVALQIAYWRRFVPALATLRERIVAGELGELLTLSCLQWDGEPPAAAFRARSGGIFVDMGVHEFDQARWLTGGDFTNVHALATSVVTDVAANGDPDSAQVLSATSTGATVLVSLGRHYSGGDMASVEVFGTRGHELSVFLDPDDGERAQLEALSRQASSFARYVAGGVCEGASVHDALAALEVAARSAAQTSLVN